MLHAYAGQFNNATVQETIQLERLNRVDFHMFIMAKKQLADESKQK